MGMPEFYGQLDEVESIATIHRAHAVRSAQRAGKVLLIDLNN